MSKNTIGQFIATLRKANGMTQQDVADRLNVSNKAVSRWERDECAPDLSAIPALAEMFGITCDELLRGERNNPDRDATEETAHKLKLKSDKQFKLMLYSRKKKFTNFTFISIGLIIVGLIAAMICNLGFSRGLLGFCLASLFLVAATICQICFTVSFRVLIDEDDTEHTEEIKKANTTMVLGSVKIFFAILMMFAFCLPIAVMTLSYYDSYYGLVVDSWLLFGTWFAIVAFLVAYCVYNLFILKTLVRKEIVYLTDDKLEKKSFMNKLLKKCCTVFVIIFSVLMVGLISVSIADENGVFVAKMTFTDPDEFIEYVQNQYDEWYEEGYGPHHEDDEYDYPNRTWAEINGKSYYYNPDLYYILDTWEYGVGKYDITIITKQSQYDADNMFNTFTSLLLVGHVLNLLGCTAWYCMGTLKRKTAK